MDWENGSVSDISEDETADGDTGDITKVTSRDTEAQGIPYSVQLAASIPVCIVVFGIIAVLAIVFWKRKSAKHLQRYSLPEKPLWEQSPLTTADGNSSSQREETQDIPDANVAH